jgi:SAM-dependent methyltransferase
MKFLRRIFFNWMYFRDPPWDTGISPPELIAFIKENPAGHALDLGCGTGTNVITLAKNGWQVTGVDFAPHGIKIARQKAKDANVDVELMVADVTRLEKVTGTFNLILDIGCYHSLSTEGKAGYRKNLERLLAPGGTYLLYAFYDEVSDGNGPGASKEDIDAFDRFLNLAHRVNGTERGRRPSAWFTYRKPRAEVLSLSSNAEREDQQQ